MMVWNWRLSWFMSSANLCRSAHSSCLSGGKGKARTVRRTHFPDRGSPVFIRGGASPMSPSIRGGRGCFGAFGFSRVLAFFVSSIAVSL
jgi:hypothetical protein